MRAGAIPRARSHGKSKARPAAWVAVAATFCLFLLSKTHLQAQIADAADEKALPQIQVESQRRSVEKRVRTFVAAITPPIFTDSLARWRYAICPNIVGRSQSRSNLILARLSEISRAIDVAIAPQPCKANFYVIETAVPDRVLQAWRKRDHLLFWRSDSKTVDRFINTPRPVRVWYNTDLVSKHVIEVANDPFRTLQLQPRMTPSASASAMASAATEAASLEFNEVQYFTSVIVVVDSGRTEGIEIGQLADYIAMIGLTKINVEADMGDTPTILRIFSAGGSEQPAPSSITAWDRVFLRGLYATRQSSRLQRMAIADMMTADMAH